MVSESVDAFVRLDLDQAREVIAYDDVVDRWFDQIKKELVPRLPRTAPLGRNCWMSSWWPNIWSGLAIMPPTWRSGWSTR